HGLPTTIRVLRTQLSRWRTLRVIRRVILGGFGDPLRDVPSEAWPPDKEALVRHQLRGALLLDDALAAESLDEDQRHALVHRVIAETGARFIQYALPLPAFDTWLAAADAPRLAFLRSATQRFFNGEMGDFIAEDRRIGFDVTACRFAQICRAMGREHLAAAFCAADSV